MRICRFQADDIDLFGFHEMGRVVPISQASEHYLEETGEDLVLPTSGDLLEFLPPIDEQFPAIRRLYEWVRVKITVDGTGFGIPVEEARLLAPLARPPKILLLAGNYAAHVAERGGTSAEREETFPYVFMKPSSSITHPGDPIRIPKSSPGHIDWECELGVIIGRRCRDVSEAESLNYVAGYTVINDVSDRKFTPTPGRKPRERDKFFDWLHGKWHDTFLPMGPCVLSADEVPDPQDLAIRLEVNGEVKQDGHTRQMIFPVAAVIAFLSSFVTLEPGDLIATGTPSGVGSASGTYLRHGDVVKATIPGIGSLENPVLAEE